MSAQLNSDHFWIIAADRSGIPINLRTIVDDLKNKSTCDNTQTVVCDEKPVKDTQKIHSVVPIRQMLSSVAFGNATQDGLFSSEIFLCRKICQLSVRII